MPKYKKSYNNNEKKYHNESFIPLHVTQLTTCPSCGRVIRIKTLSIDYAKGKRVQAYKLCKSCKKDHDDSLTSLLTE